MKICVDTTLQETVDDDFRGRVFSVYDTLFNVTFVVALLVGAFAAAGVRALVAGAWSWSPAAYLLPPSRTPAITRAPLTGRVRAPGRRPRSRAAASPVQVARGEVGDLAVAPRGT